MKRLIVTTVFNDMLGIIERLGLSDIDYQTLNLSRTFRLKHVINEKDGGKVEIYLINDKFIKEAENEFMFLNNGKYDLSDDNQRKQIIRFILERCLCFTSHDIYFYRILLSHYINNQVNGIANISLETIHLKYRNKDFLRTGDEKYDTQTLKSYLECVHKLRTLEILIQFGSSNLRAFKSYIKNDICFFHQPLLKLINENITSDELKEGVELQYSMGMFGDYILNSGQYGQILPPEIFGLRFNQVNTFNIGVYLGKLIYINRRYKKVYKVSVTTILTRFNKYAKNGHTTSTNYFNYLTSLDATKRAKKVKLINEQLSYVLDLLVKNGSIVKYEYNNKFLYKYIKDGELILTIQLKKHRGKG